jgi:hypothetical protein
MIRYDTDADIDFIMNAIDLHNSDPDGGEELVRVGLVVPDKVILFSNGGGRHRTMAWFLSRGLDIHFYEEYEDIIGHPHIG